MRASMSTFRLAALSLFLVAGSAAAVPQDGPPKPELYLYHQTNLLVDKNIDAAEQLWTRAAKAGYTKVFVADSKMAKLGDMDKRYFKNLERAKKIAADLKIELVPTLFHVGYSNSMLWHDPNLAEGLPVKDALFEVKNGEADVVADPPVAFPAKFGFKDETVSVESGVATVKDNPKLARFNYNLQLPKYRKYHVSVKIRTENYTASPEIKALGGGRSLQHQNLGVKKTQDWTEHHVVFNTLEHEKISVYFGVWDDAKGTLQWKDWKIEEAGLVNVLRRPGAPFTVQGYTEGKDYEPVVDPKLGAHPWKGEYDSWHPPVKIKTKGIADGTKLRVSWYHPAIIHDGQVSACIAEPKTMELLADEAKRIKEATGAASFMMSHDEHRSMNTCGACEKKGLDAGALLADHARQCVKLLEGSTIYVWNDMFDPYHNAVNNYYLVKGDLKGSWEGLSSNVIIMNWYFGPREKNLPFFADRGHKQVLAGYYDHDPARIKEWLKAAAKVKGVVGVMYTTWQHKYDDLEAFAKYARE
jgi:hypothetical protein